MPEAPDRQTEASEELDQQRKIRELNDRLRQTGLGGQMLMTQGVAALSFDVQARVFAAVRNYDDFTPENDPWGTHEKGFFEIDGERMMFAIDAYDRNLEYGSPDPTDPAVTTRVMTVLLMSEY